MRPTSPSILFSDIESLIKALGAGVREREGSRVKLVLEAHEWRCHRPHPGKEAKRYHRAHSQSATLIFCRTCRTLGATRRSMLFIVRFIDKPDGLPTRQEFFAAHLQWLEERQASILVAGSLREELAASPGGAIWIVEGESKAAVKALFQTDPFWIHGLRESYSVFHWSKAFPDRKTLV